MHYNTEHNILVHVTILRRTECLVLGISIIVRVDRGAAVSSGL